MVQNYTSFKHFIMLISLCCFMLLSNQNVNARKFRKDKTTEEIAKEGTHGFKSQKKKSRPTSKVPEKTTIAVVEKSEPISFDWKITTTRQFRANVDFLQEIILSGEKDTTEQQDFEKRFEKQNEWFTNTIERVNKKDDLHHKEILAKIEIIEEIANSQRHADKIIKEFIKNHAIPTNKAKSLRSHILYEINAHIEKSKAKRGRTLSDAELESLVRKSLSKSQEAEVIFTTKSEEKMAKKLQEKEQMYQSLQTDLHNMKTFMEKGERKIENLATEAQENKKQLQMIEKQRMETELKLEKERTEKLRLKNELETARQKVGQEKKQATIKMQKAQLNKKVATLNKRLHKTTEKNIDLEVKLAKKRAQKIQTPKDPYKEFEQIADLFDNVKK